MIDNYDKINAKLSLFGETYSIGSSGEIVLNHNYDLKRDSITVVKQVKELGDETFYIHKRLKKLKVLGRLERIGINCFSGSGLNEVEIFGVKVIDSNAFFCNRKLRKVEIYNDTKIIGEEAFEKCSSLVYVKIPDTVESIGEWAFKDCRSLKYINIPKSIRFIAKNAFDNCRSLDSDIREALDRLMLEK